MANKVERFRQLYTEVNKEHHQANRGELHKLLAELEEEGYRIEHAWGVYLHTPSGDTIVLDYWNE